MNIAGKATAQDQRYPAWIAVSIGVAYSALVTWAEATRLFGITDFIFFYLLGVCLVGFTASWRWAIAVALACAVMDGWWQHGREARFLSPEMIWVFSSDLGVFALAGWLADRVRLLSIERRELATENAARKAALRELEATKERLALVLQHSPACLYAADVNPPYPLLYISENVSRLFGYAAADLTGGHGQWLKHVHPDDLGHVQAYLAEFFAKGEASCEYRLQKKTALTSGFWITLNSSRTMRASPSRPWDSSRISTTERQP